MTECKQGGFSFFVKRNLTVDFKGGSITSDVGLLLAGQFDERLGLRAERGVLGGSSGAWGRWTC